MIVLEEALERASHLPSISAVLTQALDEMAKPEADIAQVAHLLEKDQGAVTRLLRVANSAFYGLPGRVSSLQQAITLIGFPTTRSLVLAAAIIDRFPSPESGHFDYFSFWGHSLGVAAAARCLAPRAKVNPETAFLAGMLHDIGIAVLGYCMSETFQAVLQKLHADECCMVDAEQQILGFTHDDLGSSMAKAWKFPEPIQEAIRSHHAVAVDASPLSRVVHVANAVALALDYGDVEDGYVPPIDPNSWRLLGLDRCNLTELLATVDVQAKSALGLMQGA